MDPSKSLIVHPSSRSVARTDRTEAVVELETAVARFQARLKDDERKRFQSLKSTPHDTQAVILFTAELDRVDSNRRGRSIASRLSSFLQTIQQFFPAVDTFVSSNPDLAALIWGSVKLTFLVLTNFTSYFESFAQLLHGFGTLCSRFTEYQLLFKTSVRLRDSICRFHSSVIACCEKLLVVASRQMVVQAAKALIMSFQSEMRQYIDDIKSKVEDVQRDIDLAKAQSDHEEHNMQAKERQQASAIRIQVLARLSKYGNQLAKVEKQAKMQAQERRHRQLLNDLSSYARCTTTFNNARNKRHLHTAEWIFETQEFNEWCSKKEVPLLHITGKIGSGKSILTSHIVEHLNEKKETGHAISFFFCRFDDADSLDCDTILRSLVHQLLSSFFDANHLLHDTTLCSALEAAETQYFSRDSLISLFSYASGLVKTWFIIIDGVDECLPKHRRSLLGFLSKLIKLDQTSEKIKLILSCRETVTEDIKQRFSSPSQIATGSGQTSEDILRYAEDIIHEKLSMNELVLEDVSLAGEILKVIALKEEGMFLWAFLTIEDICTRKNDEDIRKALQQLPIDLDATLNRALERILHHKHQEVAQAIFQWTGAVREPLSIDQLREAISIEVGSTSMNPRSLINGMERLTLWCENLVHIETEDDTVRFTHHSIRHFLSQPDNGPLHSFHFDHQESDHHVGQVCLTYINLEDFSAAPEDSSVAPEDLETETAPQFLPMLMTDFPATAIAQQAIQTAPMGIIEARIGRLMSRVMDLRDRSGSRGSSSHQASTRVEVPLTLPLPAQVVRDTSFPFLKYAEKYWHAHIQFLTVESETHPLLIGMLEGTLLAGKMPWMDESWQSSRPEPVPLSSIPRSLPFAIIYAGSIGSQDLLCHAFTHLAQIETTPSNLGSWLTFLAQKGHLGCPRNCVSEFQGRVKHRALIQIITNSIAQGNPCWPAAKPWEVMCDCTEHEKDAGIHEEICDILVTGYDAASQPLLELFAGVLTRRFNRSSFNKLCRRRNLTDPVLLRARTATGKSFLDLEVESCRLGHTPLPFKPHRFLLDIFDRDYIVERGQELQFDLGELQLLVMKALLRTTLQPVQVGAMDGLFDVIVQVGCPAVLDCSFSDAEMMISEAMKRTLPDAVNQKLVEFYIASGVNLSHFQKSRVASFRLAMENRNWGIARALADTQPELATNFGGDGARMLLWTLRCPDCARRQFTNVILCRPHLEQATVVFHDTGRNRSDGPDDDDVELLWQITSMSQFGFKRL
ncbi:hypothetical protein B0T10DRAFT_591185 [Thelonectria olida]|uniref:NACHT domain-containing protein n=1 Tax=Thelonectria olida TaxID=1576542 RepID=A0A9P8VPE4_9HYPO|nr:hypothetical protein B0T10DRAFT_591185 [Thelonectria olida]